MHVVSRTVSKQPLGDCLGLWVWGLGFRAPRCRTRKYALDKHRPRASHVYTSILQHITTLQYRIVYFIL